MGSWGDRRRRHHRWVAVGRRRVLCSQMESPVQLGRHLGRSAGDLPRGPRLGRPGLRCDGLWPLGCRRDTHQWRVVVGSTRRYVGADDRSGALLLRGTSRPLLSAETKSVPAPCQRTAV